MQAHWAHVAGCRNKGCQYPHCWSSK
jgi:hypothetical protein